MKISYAVNYSARARRVRVTVRPGGSVVVTVPRGATVEAAQRFVAQKISWLERAIAKMQLVKPRIALPRFQYKLKRKEAEQFIRQRIVELNKAYGFSYRAITIRNQKTRWGSCSRKGTLSFNYRLLLLPSELADYVIVHELCHLAEFNHSRRFWALVAGSIPNPLAVRQSLRRYDLRLG